MHNCDDSPFTFTTGLRTHFATRDIPTYSNYVKTLGLRGEGAGRRAWRRWGPAMWQQAACTATGGAASPCAAAAPPALAHRSPAQHCKPAWCLYRSMLLVLHVPPCTAGKYILDYGRNPLKPRLGVEDAHNVTFGSMAPLNRLYVDCEAQGDVLFCPGAPVSTACVCVCV